MVGTLLIPLLMAEASLSSVVLSATSPTLTLVDVVSGGSASPSAWTLNAGNTTFSASGPGPTAGPITLTIGVGYTLFETGGASGYSASGWSCSDPTGAAVAMVGNVVALGAGQNATCTITNTFASGNSPTLTLIDVVSGGSASPSAWTLNAGNSTSSVSGPGPSTGPSVLVAGVAYTLFETGGASGYTASGWSCTDPTGAAVSRSGNVVTLVSGQDATCTITNTYASGTPPTLRLVDVVSGGSASPSAWTLNMGNSTYSSSGAGPTVGPTTLTAAVNYTIFETGGASGYTASGWSCSDPTGAAVSLVGNVVKLASGQNATCTVTNTFSSAPPVGIAVPSSIDSTGASDASAALMSFLNTVPDGSTIVFKAGGYYRMDQALKFAHRHNLTFDGNGATLKSNGGTTEASALIWVGSYLGGNSGIVIKNFNLVGNSPTPGIFVDPSEGAHGIIVDGSQNVEVFNITVNAVWGDCFYVGSWSDTVWFHDSNCQTTGRDGVTVSAGKNVTVERVAFPTIGYVTFNVEPNKITEGATNIIFRNNTAGTWGQDFVAVEGSHLGAPIHGVTVSGNTVSGKTLHAVIDNGGTSRMTGIVFTNNRSTVMGYPPELIFAHIDGLTVTGNVQQVSFGSVISISDSTSVTYP